MTNRSTAIVIMDFMQIKSRNKKLNCKTKAGIEYV